MIRRTNTKKLIYFVAMAGVGSDYAIQRVEMFHSRAQHVGAACITSSRISTS